MTNEQILMILGSVILSYLILAYIMEMYPFKNSSENLIGGAQQQNWYKAPGKLDCSCVARGENGATAAVGLTSNNLFATMPGPGMVPSTGPQMLPQNTSGPLPQPPVQLPQPPVQLPQPPVQQLPQPPVQQPPQPPVQLPQPPSPFQPPVQQQPQQPQTNVCVYDHSMIYRTGAADFWTDKYASDAKAICSSKKSRGACNYSLGWGCRWVD